MAYGLGHPRSLKVMKKNWALKICEKKIIVPWIDEKKKIVPWIDEKKIIVPWISTKKKIVP